MASSSLSGRRYRGSYPPYCIPRPPIGPVIPPTLPALRLQTYARWTDLDPIAPGDQYCYFTLNWIGPTVLFRGSSSRSGDRLVVAIEQLGSTPYWDVTLQIYDPYRFPETFVWHGVHVDPKKPFDTRTLHDIILPTKDYRYARITS